MKKCIIFILVIAFLTSCSDENELERDDGLVPFRELANDLTGCWLQNKNEKGPEKFVIIKDGTDLAYFISCEKIIGTVDFEEEYVLAGRVNLTQCGFLKSQSLALKNNRLEYRLEVEVALCQMP